MKEFLIGWLIFQIVFLGAITWNIAYERNTNTYDCSIHEINEPNNWDRFGFISVWIVFPVIIFTTDIDTKGYCENK